MKPAAPPASTAAPWAMQLDDRPAGTVRGPATGPLGADFGEVQDAGVPQPGWIGYVGFAVVQRAGPLLACTTSALFVT